MWRNEFRPTIRGMNPSDLPIESCLPQIVSAVLGSRPVVVKAPPGAGKTSGVPPALIQAGVADQGQVLLIQPRRLAARSAAYRLANLMKTRVGERVGYHVRFDRQASDQTQVLAMTTGMLLRRLQSDPLLEKVSCVLLDEFHERSLELDLSLGMLQRIRTSLRPELTLVVMSATLDPAPICEFLGSAEGVVSEGRSFEVDIRYRPEHSSDRVEEQVAAVMPQALRETEGHLLVFLPGVGEIRRTHRALRQQGLDQQCVIIELYGNLSPSDQDAALAETGHRKIVLATNIAETSLTIPGVTGVIDSGLARVMRFDPRRGLPQLEREPISQASAQQRAGRAGRTAPGICWRLWPAATHRARRQRDVPEIERTDFSGALLTLASWGERDVDAFPWLTPPPEDAVRRADALLRRLGATDEQLMLTDIGRRMVQLPVAPRMARFVIAAADAGAGREAALVAAMLSERDPFRHVSDGSVSVSSTSVSDVVDRLERLRSVSNGNDRQASNPAAIRQVQRVAKQLGRHLNAADQSLNRADPYRSAADPEIAGNAPPDAPLTHDRVGEIIMRSLLTAYPDRLARRRQSGSERALMVGGRGVKLDRASRVQNAEFFLCIDVDSQGEEARVRIASAVDESWLEPKLIRELDEPFFHPTRQAVVMRRRRYFADLLLNEHPIECRPTEETSRLLLHQAKAAWPQVFPVEDEAVAGFVQRVRFLERHAPELDLPTLDQAALEDVLQQLCQTRTSLDQLRRAPWAEFLKGRFGYEQLRTIDREAPSRLEVPSGKSVAIVYDEEAAPVIQVRVQELFGWKETPRLAKGRVPVLLHLLGPNYRPQQITDDLGNFWRTTYQTVRKELRRRYPKHFWPEDPLEANATRDGLKPKRS